MQIMQISSLTMHDTKMYEAESDSTEKNRSRISHKINDWLINQISTGKSLPRPPLSDQGQGHGITLNLFSDTPS